MLRFFRLLSIFAEQYEVSFFALQMDNQNREIGEEAIGEYTRQLVSAGISFNQGSRVELTRFVGRQKFDVVFFEHYQFALPFIDEVRYFQPRAKIVIDTIDLNYLRLASKAEVSQHDSDRAEATAVKLSEMSAYRRSDVVIAISDQDRDVLAEEDCEIRVKVIPLVFEVPQLRSPRDGSTCNLIFVGNFQHAANVDAIVFFCERVFPALKEKISNAKLTVIGNAPTQAVLNLSTNDVQVLGFVPDVTPHYRDSDISIAPLTWGGGLKGKIAEAMAHGLPVVATTVGVSGFGLSSGNNVVVADAPSDFVDGIAKLHLDREFYELIRKNGWAFVEAHFGEKAIRARVKALFDQIYLCRPKKMPALQWLRRRTASLLDTHVLWRFRR